MKLHAGHAIVVAMAAFILIMVQFMVRAYHNQESLVAEDYYAKELRYQEQIDKLRNAAALEQEVRFDALPGRLVITFPPSVPPATIKGELFMMRPNDESADRRVPLRVDPQGRFSVDTSDLPKGAYSVHLEWKAQDVAYLTEDRIHLE
jgi:nitrogen fixation protein FixH